MSRVSKFATGLVFMGEDGTSITRCRIIRMNLPKSRPRQSGDSSQDPVDPLERNLCDLLAGLLWELKLETILIEQNGIKILIWECLVDLCYSHHALCR